MTTVGKRLEIAVREVTARRGKSRSGFVPLPLVLVIVLVVGWSLLVAGALALGQVLPSRGIITFEGVKNGSLDLFVLDLDRGLTHNLTRSLVNDETGAWSPDQRRLAFVSLRDGVRHLYLLTMGLSGGPRHLTYGRIALGTTLSWSPDGRYIAYEVDYRSGIDLYLIEVDAPILPNVNPRALTNDATDSRYPVWSPDGSRLAYTSYSDGNAEIYTINPQTMQTENLTQHPDWDFSPSWSGDGALLAFYSDRTGSRELYIMNADGSETRQLSNDDRVQNPRFVTAPAWSPDGSQIAYPVVYNLNVEIVVINVVTGEQRQLTHNFAIDTHPVWLADGSGIVYLSDRGGHWGLYLVESSGLYTRQLTTGVADRGTLSLWNRYVSGD